jgi:hypothetical protein
MHKDKAVDQIYLQRSDLLNDDDRLIGWISRDRNDSFNLQPSPLAETILQWRETEQRMKARRKWSEAEYVEASKHHMKISHKLKVEMLGSGRWRIK